tara:strand:+ start:394 stop:900 length:507 start_codon:yes stop_codon:yes gene_type:complete
MEKRINGILSDYQKKFKDDIRTFILEHKDEKDKNTLVSELMEFVYSYKNLNLETKDFNRRKRVKNHVPIYLLCTAKKADGTQCTRRKKEGKSFCGTHEKGRPHGEITNNLENSDLKIEVRTQEINGIVYYIDKKENVYDNHDVHENKKNPKIIAKYTITKEGEYKLIK